MDNKIAIIGSVGVPAGYGGFETLAENLVRFHHSHELPDELTVYCSSHSYRETPDTFLSARLKYIPLNANGVQSIPYDIWAMISAVINRSDVILVLGVSGAVALPLVRLFSSTKIITNIDGIEWRRDKWRGFAGKFLHFSERMAVLFSHKIIADNQAIAQYVKSAYDKECYTIAYGGDHALQHKCLDLNEYDLPQTYCFSVCRIEPENNIHLILDAFAQSPGQSIVIVGNWDYSEYGRNLKHKYAQIKNIVLLDPIYDIGKLATMRSQATYYLHGHSAGGTNPSLVEAMFFGRPIIAFDCIYNRYTTCNKALYFTTSEDIITILASAHDEFSGAELKSLAQEMYTWENIAKQYFLLIEP